MGEVTAVGVGLGVIGGSGAGAVLGSGTGTTVRVGVGAPDAGSGVCVVITAGSGAEVGTNWVTATSVGAVSVVEFGVVATVGIGQLVLETGNVLWRRRDVVPNADPNASTGTGEIGRVAWRLTRSVTVHTVCSIPECRVYEGTGRNLGGSGRGLPPVG